MAGRRKRAQPKTPRSQRGARASAVAKAVARDEGPYTRALKAVAAWLEHLEAPAALIGGAAVIAHGVARFTADIDAAIATDPADVGAVMRSAHRFGLTPRIDEAATFATQNLVLLLHHASSGVPVDVSFALQPFEQAGATEASLRRIGHVRARVIPLTTLLIYKMVAGRPKDLDDVRGLLETAAPFDQAAVVSTLREFDAILDSDRASEFVELIP
jgi:hypothetical protein